MKKLLVILLMIVFATNSFSQNQNLTKDEYLVKSKQQKGNAWGLLISGGCLVGVGVLLINSSLSNAPLGAVLGGTGIVLAGWSIPIFISAGKNKNMYMSMALKNEMQPMPENSGLRKTVCPSLSFSIRL